FRARHFLHRHAAAFAGPLDVDGLDAREIAVRIADEALAEQAVLARILAELSGRLGVTVVNAEDLRPQRPWVVGGTIFRRLRHQFEIDDIFGAVTDRRADAVGACIAAADDNDILVLGRNVIAVLEVGIEQALGVGLEEFHCQMNTLQLAIFDRQVAAVGSAGGQHYRIVFLLQFFRIDRIGASAADIGVGDEVDTLGLQQIDTALHHVLAELHVRNAVHQQAADTIGALVHGHRVAELIQLRGSGETRWTRADNRDLLAGARRRRLRHHPAFLEAAINARVLNIPDRHRLLDGAEHAGTVARCRANTTGELGKIVGEMQAIERVLPAIFVNQIIPFGNQIGNGAAIAGLAKWNTAIHAARRLYSQRRLVDLGVQLFVIQQARVNITVGLLLARKLFETGWFTHRFTLSPLLSLHRWRAHAPSLRIYRQPAQALTAI